jgi:hypothetical protein
MGLTHGTVYRDSLHFDIQHMSEHATALEQTSKEDRRRKLEERLNRFHLKAEKYMGQNAEEDLDILPQYTGWERNDDEKNDSLSDLQKEDESDEEEDFPNPETMPICMPSSLKREDIQRLRLEILAAQELELRKGQDSDCLQNLRMLLGHKAALYRTKVRTAKTSVAKTRVLGDVKAIRVKTNKHLRAYRQARKALKHLGADDATLMQYQELQSEHLALNENITEENRVGQRSHAMPWIWKSGGQNADQDDAWMQECESMFVCKCSY